ncbi:glutathione S-transferase family protein [Tateyamaria sp.]|uniref:glutathione S-transferase family protein n=1 Tax=Tateyamaria sp. TaxID=1929288 RepID=UPI0032A0C45A
MIQLYGYDTINTMKVLMLLHEVELEYEFVPIDIRNGEQHTPEFRAVNPVGKVPVLCDGDICQTESNSILLTLAQKSGWGMVGDPASHERLVAWLFYQASTQGPYFGQIEYWSKLAKTPNPDALAHYHAIANRTIEHLEGQLGNAQYFCGSTYSIADIALFPWLHAHEQLGLTLDDADNLLRWLNRIRARAATKKTFVLFEEIGT